MWAVCKWQFEMGAHILLNKIKNENLEQFALSPSCCAFHWISMNLSRKKSGETPSAVIKFAVAGSSARGEDGFDLIYFFLSFACVYHFDACFEVAVSRLKLMHSLSTPPDRFIRFILCLVNRTKINFFLLAVLRKKTPHCSQLLD